MEETSESEELAAPVTTWRQKISSKIKALNFYSPEMFVKSQWQKSSSISLYYLVYRWVIAVLFLIITISSILELGRSKTGIVQHLKWAAYLTNWGITFCLLQALLGAYLVTRTFCKQPEEEVEELKMNCSLRTYWVLHTIATVVAFTITCIYWTLEFDPAVGSPDAVNILVHVCNSILMLIDLLVIAHPVRLIDFYRPLIFSLVYSFFNYFYFLAGGTDKYGRHYLYKLINWKWPLKALIVILNCLVLVVILHILVSVVCLLKRKTANLLRNPDENKKVSEEETGSMDRI